MNKEVLDWYNNIMIKYPKFNVNNWIPPTVKYSHLTLKQIVKLLENKC